MTTNIVSKTPEEKEFIESDRIYAAITFASVEAIDILIASLQEKRDEMLRSATND